MFSLLSEMFSYAFLVRAVVVGFCVSIVASLLGVSHVLKRYSMIGDGLSHVGFGGLAIATAMNAAPLMVSIPVVIIAAFVLLRISESSQLKGDAAIALISISSLAIGIFVISVTTGLNTDVCNYLFGSILAMSHADAWVSVTLSIAILLFFVLFYNKIFAITFDEAFMRASGAKTRGYNMLIALLTAITIAIGMRMMGALLISSLVVLPALTAMRLFKTFKSVTAAAALISLFCFSVGIVISYVYGTPSGASIVIVNLALFIVFWLIKIWRKT
jgi:zinc transport system permease protein